MSKMTNEDLKNIFIDTTYNNKTQVEIAKEYGVDNSTLNRELRSYMLGALNYDRLHQDLSVDERAKEYDLSKSEYNHLLFRGRSKLLLKGR